MTAIILAFVSMLKVPSILFMCIVAPMWIGLHYKARRRDASQLSADERNALEALTRAAERMEERIGTLERILDAEAPRWKERWRDAPR